MFDLSPSKLNRLRSLCLWIGVGGVWLVTAVTLAWQWDYYSLPVHQRPHHAEHFLLRPSGFWGLLLGITATSFFVLNLGYILRKQFIHIESWGSLRFWMDLHVLTGLAGAGLIVLHFSLILQSLLGVLAVVALTITVVTGIIGRYIYIRVPHSLQGQILLYQQVREQLRDYQDQLEQAGLNAQCLDLPHTSDYDRHKRGILSDLITLITGQLQSRRQYYRIHKSITSLALSRTDESRILSLVRVFCRYQQWFLKYDSLRRLLASWRFFHLWWAVVMFCTVIAHVILALRYGDLSALGAAP
jgi:dihydropyrimidine dehydrogenase (NAD+) subunit PreT